MPQMIQDVMTRDPISLSGTSTAADAARKMREADIGPVVVLDGGRVSGIVTDRDIVVRVVAEGKDPATTPLNAICSENLFTLAPDSPVGTAVKLMKEKAVRRVPIVKEGKPVGILSLGDVAAERDSKSVLGRISEAPPNN